MRVFNRVCVFCFVLYYYYGEAVAVLRDIRTSTSVADWKEIRGSHPLCFMLMNAEQLQVNFLLGRLGPVDMLLLLLVGPCG